MYSALRPLLLRLPGELAHDLTLAGLDTLQRLHMSRLAGGRSVEDPRELLGLRFPNAVGLAAGLDKNGDHIHALGALGFGFLEIGTVTPRPQPGNPKPRMFRLPAADGLINRMGFNNKGVDYLCERVREAAWSGILGINIGKNRDTPVERAADDYRLCLEKVYPLASYVTVNLSSPNTPGLRDLQFGEPLRGLLAALLAARRRLSDAHGREVPLLLKIAPDMAPEDLDEILDAVRRQRIDGLIATNTTLSREHVEGLRHAEEAGGLSGAPLTARAEAVTRYLASRLAGELPLIGVGGIMSGEDAARRIAAGADLVQLYTGLVYGGPALVAEAAAAIADARAA